MAYYFQTEQLAVGYQGISLIKEINIQIKKGEILTLIGPNGAGKSTILKSIAKQIECVGGKIYLDKQELDQFTKNELAKKMAVVLTERMHTELMTCEDVVATGRYPYTGYFGIRTKEDQKKIEEAISLVHMETIRGSDFAKISDGQRQRVMLARAICQQPEVIILDEPTSFLDIRYKLEFLSLLQNLRRQKNLTVIMSLHELDLAERVSDKILCVKGDKIHKFGPPEEIFVDDYIKELFDIKNGSFDEKNGVLELQKVSEISDIFVIAGGGSGRGVYRFLQRKGCAFFTGILYENDLDFPSAKALAQEVFVSEAFEEVSPDLVEEAKRTLDRCSKVICSKHSFGKMEWMNQELLQYAEKNGKKIEYWEKESSKKE